MKEIILTYTHKHLDNFRYHFLEAKETLNTESIHQYRVSIKRVRAVVNALNKILPDKSISRNDFKPFRQVFKAGGSIRDDQVHQSIIRQIESGNGNYFPLIRQRMENKIRDQKDLFHLKALNFDESSITRFYDLLSMILDPCDNEELHHEIFRMVHRSLEKLRMHSMIIVSPEELHAFRIRFKNLVYIVEMMQESDAQPRASQEDYSRFKAFAEELGTWHDYYALVNNITSIAYETHDAGLLSETSRLFKIASPIQQEHYEKVLEKLKDKHLLSLL